jgi:hypothetical protein
MVFSTIQHFVIMEMMVRLMVDGSCLVLSNSGGLKKVNMNVKYYAISLVVTELRKAETTKQASMTTDTDVENPLECLPTKPLGAPALLAGRPLKRFWEE